MFHTSESWSLAALGCNVSLNAPQADFSKSSISPPSSLHNHKLILGKRKVTLMDHPLKSLQVHVSDFLPLVVVETERATNTCWRFQHESQSSDQALHHRPPTHCGTQSCIVGNVGTRVGQSIILNLIRGSRIDSVQNLIGHIDPSADVQHSCKPMKDSASCASSISISSCSLAPCLGSSTSWRRSCDFIRTLLTPPQKKTKKQWWLLILSLGSCLRPTPLTLHAVIWYFVNLAASPPFYSQWTLVGRVWSEIVESFCRLSFSAVESMMSSR